MLEKQIVVDQIEVVENGVVQVRTATRIVENGEILSSSLHRHVIVPGDDYSQEDAKVQAICAVIQTPDVIAAYEAAVEAAKPAALEV
jgi:hypothetical protein